MQSPEGLYLCRCNSANTDILDCTENGADVVLRVGEGRGGEERRVGEGEGGEESG